MMTIEIVGEGAASIAKVVDTLEKEPWLLPVELDEKDGSWDLSVSVFGRATLTAVTANRWRVSFRTQSMHFAYSVAAVVAQLSNGKVRPHDEMDWRSPQEVAIYGLHGPLITSANTVVRWLGAAQERDFRGLPAVAKRLKGSALADSTREQLLEAAIAFVANARKLQDEAAAHVVSAFSDPCTAILETQKAIEPPEKPKGKFALQRNHSGDAVCHRCERVIQKGYFRFGFEQEDHFHWMHLHCATAYKNEVRALAERFEIADEESATVRAALRESNKLQNLPCGECVTKPTRCVSCGDAIGKRELAIAFAFEGDLAAVHLHPQCGIPFFTQLGKPLVQLVEALVQNSVDLNDHDLELLLSQLDEQRAAEPSKKFSAAIANATRVVREFARGHRQWEEDSNEILIALDELANAPEKGPTIKGRIAQVLHRMHRTCERDARLIPEEDAIYRMRPWVDQVLELSA